MEEPVREILEDFEERKRIRREQELQWRLNLGYLAGRQFDAVTPRGEIEPEEKRYRWERRDVFNHIAPLCETRLAKLSRLRPVMAVRAATTEAADADTAKLATKILRGCFDQNRLPAVIAEATRWSEVCGTAFYKVVWDGEGGGKLADTEEGGEFFGDVKIAAVPPFEIYPASPETGNLQDQPSILHARAYPVSEIEQVWGVKVAGAELNVFTLEREGVSSQSMKDAAVVVERYERPCRNLPEGRLTILGGETLLYSGPLPYRNGPEGKPCYPFARQCSLRNSSGFWGTSLVERLIPVQRAYNTVQNRKYEFLNRATAGVLAVEDGSVDTDDLEDEGLSPGKVLIYRQGAPIPRELTLGSVPLDFSREEQRLLDEFTLLSGVSDFMQNSRVYSENASGVALQLLTEQDDTRLVVSSEEIKEALKDAARQTLRLYRQFADVPRLLSVSGESGEREVVHFTGSQITSFDAVFETESELSETPAQRRAMVLELLRAGLLYDGEGRLSPSMRKRVLDLLGFAALAEEDEK